MRALIALNLCLATANVVLGDAIFAAIHASVAGYLLAREVYRRAVDALAAELHEARLAAAIRDAQATVVTGHAEVEQRVALEVAEVLEGWRAQ